MKLKVYSILALTFSLFFISCNAEDTQEAIALETETKAISEISTEKTAEIDEQNQDPKHYIFEEHRDQKFILPLYGINRVKGEVLYTNVLEEYVSIDRDMPMEKVAEVIANFVSKKMGGLRIGTKIEDIGNGVLCLNLELIEHDTEEEYWEQSWREAFAASGSAAHSLKLIVPNFLQKDYKGPWIDLIRFEDEGDGTTKHEYLRYEENHYYLD